MICKKKHGANCSAVSLHIFTQSFVLHLAVVQVSTLLLLEQVLQAFELVNVERLEPDELFSSDERHLLRCVHSCMSAIYKENKQTHSP